MVHISLSAYHYLTRCFLATNFTNHDPEVSSTSPKNSTMYLSFALPAGTPTAIGSTAAEIRKFVELQMNSPSPPSVINFTNVPPQIVEESNDRPTQILGTKCARVLYDRGLRQLIIKLTSEPHEVAHRTLSRQIETQATDMGILGDLKSLGSTRVTSRDISKEPDSAFRPITIPAGRDRRWPSVVIESGYSESTIHLRQMADLWVSESDGQVKVVIIISIERARGRILIEKWIPNPAPLSTGPALRNRGRSALREQTITLTKTHNRPATVTGAPLVIGFHEMFLRNPADGHGEGF